LHIRPSVTPNVIADQEVTHLSVHVCSPAVSLLPSSASSLCLLACCGVLAPHQVCACVQADGGSNAENLALNIVFSSLLFSPVCLCAGRWREQCRELSTAKHSGPAAYGSSLLLGPAHALGAGPVRCSFVRSLVHAFVCFFVCSFVRSFIPGKHVFPLGQGLVLRNSLHVCMLHVPSRALPQCCRK